MATIALSIAGRAAGAALGPLGAIGGALVGGIVGSYIDQAFVLPYLFPAPQVAPQRLDQIQVSHQDEGSPANYVVAGSPRVEGTVIWQSDLIEFKKKKDQGKGGGGQQVTTYSYYYNVAVAAAIDQVSEIDRIIIEGVEIYNRSPSVTYTSSLLSVTTQAAGNALRMRVNSPSGGPDLSRFRDGYDIVISGFANAANNGTFRCRGSGKDRATGASYVLLKRSSAVVESAGSSATLTQTLPTFDPAKVTSITLHKGTGSQTADPLIEASEGTGNVPGYRGTTYVVFERLALKEFGNRAPQAFNFVLTAASSTLQTAITRLCTRTGRSSGEFDVSGLSGTVAAYAISGPIPMADAIQPLTVAYDILTQESDSGLRFFHRRDARIIDVAEGDLGCVDFGSNAPFPISIDDSSETRLPDVVIVNHQDTEKDLQPGSQKELQGTRAFSNETLTIDLPIGLTGAQARAIARRMRWLAWNHRKVNLTLPYQYADVQENDCLRFRAIGEQWLVLVNRIDIGANFVIKAECTIELRDILTQTEEADEPFASSAQPSLGGGEIEGDVIELPPLNGGAGNGHDVPYITGSAAKHDPDDPWTGAFLYQSKDDAEFDLFETELDTEATRGFATTELGTIADPSSWDLENTVDVFLLEGELESRTELEVLNGANRALIGTEIIGFKTATLLSAQNYRLSGLVRGLRDTMDQMTEHAVGERFVFLNGGGVRQMPIPPSWIGTDRYVRIVPGGGDVDDYESQEITITGASLRPFSPAQGDLFRSGTGEITLTWHRRTRALARIFGSPIPLLELTEAYEVDVIYPAESGTVVRTIDATTESATYSVAHQGDDGVTLFDDVEFRVYQISEIYGRGKALTVIG